MASSSKSNTRKTPSVTPETEMDRLTKEEKRINEIRKGEKRKYLEAKESVENQNKALRLKIDQCKDKLVKELDEKWERIQKDTNTEIRRLLDMKEKLGDKKSKNQIKVRSTRRSKIPTVVKSTEESIHEGSVRFDSIPTFLPGQITEYNVGSLFQEIGADISVKILQKYTTDISQVFYLTPNKDCSIWISNHKIIQRVKPTAYNLKVVSSIDKLVYGMGITPMNNLLLTTAESTLKQIRCNRGKLTLIDSIYNVNPLQGTAVHVNREGKVIVGAKYGRTYQGRTAVIRMDGKGRQEKIYETDHNNQQIFCYVECITSTNRGIFVVDRFSENCNGRVVVLGLEGGILNTYNGNPNLCSEKRQFQPVNVATTPSDNVIVPNLNNNILHILSCTGNLITFYDTTKIDIDRPYSLGYTAAGTVYIGCSSAVGSTENAKLYEVTINGV